MKNKTIENIEYYTNKLFPINRSITGEGNRKSLNILKEIIPINIIEYQSGTKVYDWTIPPEWNLVDGWIKNSKGEKIVDLKNSNLHIVSYSQKIHKKIKFKELKKHVYYNEIQPDAIPYITSYYDKHWGFCLSFNDFKNHFKENETYEVFIDSSHTKGNLTVGEILVHGKKKEEYLISTYICHPEMANDNLSGMIMTSFLAKKMLEMKLEYSYRIIFVPETIGAISYCYHNQSSMKKTRGGIVVTCVGGPGQFSLKKSFVKNNFIDKVAQKTLKESGERFIEYKFIPQGSDERQYSSPGFRIPCISICKDKYWEYPAYHTSLDNLKFVRPENIFKSLEIYLRLIKNIDKEKFFTSKNQDCEIQLGKRNLYPKLGIGKEKRNLALSAILWVLFFSDGKTTIEEMVEKSEMTRKEIVTAIKKLKDREIIT